MVKQIYACLIDQEPAYLYDQLVQVNHGARVTHAVAANVLSVPKAKSRYGQYGFSFRGPRQWNVTKLELKAAVNKVQLKSLLETSWYD